MGRILFQWNIPMTAGGNESATLRFVAHHLHHCATVVPAWNTYRIIIINVLYKVIVHQVGHLPRHGNVVNNCKIRNKMLWRCATSLNSCISLCIKLFFCHFSMQLAAIRATDTERLTNKTNYNHKRAKTDIRVVNFFTSQNNLNTYSTYKTTSNIKFV
jgi:hypothetical protein